MIGMMYIVSLLLLWMNLKMTAFQLARWPIWLTLSLVALTGIWTLYLLLMDTRDGLLAWLGRLGPYLILLGCVSRLVWVETAIKPGLDLVRHTSTDKLRTLGRHLVVGYKNLDEVSWLAEKGLIGGVFVTTRNIEGKSRLQFQSEIRHLQALRTKNGLPPLFVMADQEGGKVSRLSPLISRLPSLQKKVLTAFEHGKLDESVRVYADIHGRQLRSLGVNMNLGPVVDLKPKVPGGFKDVFTDLSHRSIHEEPWVVTRVSNAYCQTLRRHGVIPTLKHFPGLSRVRSDTHLKVGRLDEKPSELESSDWVPFKNVDNSRLQAIMVGHVIVAQVDESQLASQSRRLVLELLRRNWGFRGLVITDDMTMAPVLESEGGLDLAAVKSLNAGVDLVLVSQRPSNIYRMLAGLIRAETSGDLNSRVLADSRYRLDRVTDTLQCHLAGNINDEQWRLTSLASGLESQKRQGGNDE